MHLLQVLCAQPASQPASSPPLPPARQICGFNVPRGHGRGVLSMQSGPLPERIPLIVVVGAPLRLPEFKGEAWGNVAGCLQIVQTCCCSGS